MQAILGVVLVASLLSVATSMKEWKNFENGKVHSRKMTSDPQDNEASVHKVGMEERLLHSHHKDKSLQQMAEVKGERHRKSVEEKLHLRPLNERHHKFPNPELLDKSFNSPSSKVSRHTFLQQVRRKQNRRKARGGKRLKRNKTEHSSQELLNNNSDIKPDNKMEHEVDQESTLQKLPTASNVKSAQYNPIRKEGYPVKQTSYW